MMNRKDINNIYIIIFIITHYSLDLNLKGVGRLSSIMSQEVIYFLIIRDTSTQASAWTKNNYINYLRVFSLYFLL